MDILQIRYFSKVYETLNYAHAAEQLYVSRQALRKVIHNLEREVGTPLFANESNRLHATATADRIYRLSRTAVRGFRELEDGVASLKLAQAGVLRIGATYDADEAFGREEREAFRSYPPELQPVSIADLRHRSGTKTEILAALLDGGLDYAHVLGLSFDESLFDCRVARRGRLHLVMHRDSALARSGRASVHVDDLEGRLVSLPGPGNDIAEALETQARLHGFELQAYRYDPALHTRLVDAQMNMAACVSYLPRSYPRQAPDTVSLPFEEAFLEWRLCAMAPKGQGDPYLMRYFAGEEIDWEGYVRQRREEPGQRGAERSR